MPFDPVTLDVIWNRLISICDEAEAGLMRTAFSPRIREGRDFCCVLLDTKGDSIAQGSLSQVGFATTAPRAAQNVLKRFPAETLEPGDILITNNPWLQSGHLYDNFVLEPIFHRGKLIALAGSVAHWSDIGGRGERSDNRSIYEEGLQLSVLKIGKRGQLNEEVMEIIRENVRFPHEVINEFNSQLIGISVIRSKLIELIESRGIEDVAELGESILARSESAMRHAIDQIPDGDYENEVSFEGIDRELVLKLKLSVRGTDIHVDFAGSSPQSEWSINSMPNYSYTYTFVGIKAAVAPYLPNNSGQMRPVTMSLPLGSIVNPRYRSVGAAYRHIVAHYCCLGVVGALSKALPQRALAESSSGGTAVVLNGITEGSKPFFAEVRGGCAMGGSQNRDGVSGVNWPMSVRNIPIEIAESSWPMPVTERKQIRADSGGPGRYRGGCGTEVDVRVIGKVSAECYSMLRRVEHPAQGLCGGQPGAAGRLILNGSPLPALATFSVKFGDRISARSAGAGGFGDPLERDPRLVLEDVVAELVSPEQAEASYGVVIDPVTKGLDLQATAALRRSRRLEEPGLSATSARD